LKEVTNVKIIMKKILEYLLDHSISCFLRVTALQQLWRARDWCYYRFSRTFPRSMHWCVFPA